jgi:predicted DNA-binding transcriptional regulator AlpA
MRKRRAISAAVSLATGTPQPQNPAEFDLVIAARLSRELGISPVSLWRWRRSRGFPPGTRINRRVYFSRSAVREWLASQQHDARVGVFTRCSPASEIVR